MWLSYAKLSLDVNVCAWWPTQNCRPIQGLFPLHAHGIHSKSNATPWMNEWYTHTLFIKILFKIFLSYFKNLSEIVYFSGNNNCISRSINIHTHTHTSTLMPQTESDYKWPCTFFPTYSASVPQRCHLKQRPESVWWSQNYKEECHIQVIFPVMCNLHLKISVSSRILTVSPFWPSPVYWSHFKFYKVTRPVCHMSSPHIPGP